MCKGVQKRKGLVPNRRRVDPPVAELWFCPFLKKKKNIYIEISLTKIVFSLQLKTILKGFL